MKSFQSNLLVAVGVVSVAIAAVFLFNMERANSNEQPVTRRLAPEFHQTAPEAWLNSPPLRLADLRGKVVMLDFWTFDCWNCYRSFPWMNAMEARLQDEDFIIIGVHTPEFEHEKVRANIEAKIQEFELKHPTVMDNDFTYWRAMNNRYWPSYYLIDKQGNIRHNYVGETHADSAQALAIESRITALLHEPN